jgi:hypothetical protein
MKKTIQRFALWLLSLFPVPVDNTLPDYAIRAEVLVREQEAFTDTSGEYKRHQVYAKLIKEFPDVRQRDLGLAIELAVQRIE